MALQIVICHRVHREHRGGWGHGSFLGIISEFMFDFHISVISVSSVAKMI